MKKVRIVLGEPAFRALVRGGEVTVIDKETNTEVKMILQDIGFDVMSRALADAVHQESHYKPVKVLSTGEEIQ